MLVVLVLLAAGGPSAAQEGYDPYSQIYGPPVDVPLAELAQGTIPYEGRPVRTRGTLDLLNDTSSLTSTDPSLRRQYVLRDSGFKILMVPRPELQQTWLFEAPGLLGRRLEVTGLYSSGSWESIGGPSGALEFWRFVESREERTRRRKVREIDLEMLTRQPASYEGRQVRVQGEFRGANLFGDLPRRSQRSSIDWVIRNGTAALWVTGKPPRGDGWELDPRSRKDTGRWIEVEGEVRQVDGVVYLQASFVALTSQPNPEVDQTQEAMPESPPEPPVIVFSLPLDGDTDVAPTSRFAVQFSKDMDEKTFAGHVALKYAGPVRPGDRAFDHLSLDYDGGRRALHVDPGDVLQPGREVELLLLKGIADVEGLGLVPRTGHPVAGNSVDRLTYVVAF
jgi:hypothetical protein